MGAGLSGNRTESAEAGGAQQPRRLNGATVLGALSGPVLAGGRALLPTLRYTAPSSQYMTDEPKSWSTNKQTNKHRSSATAHRPSRPTGAEHAHKHTHKHTRRRCRAMEQPRHRKRPARQRRKPRIGAPPFPVAVFACAHSAVSVLLLRGSLLESTHHPDETQWPADAVERVVAPARDACAPAERVAQPRQRRRAPTATAARHGALPPSCRTRDSPSRRRHAAAGATLRWACLPAVSPPQQGSTRRSHLAAWLGVLK